MISTGADASFSQMARDLDLRLSELSAARGPKSGRSQALGARNTPRRCETRSKWVALRALCQVVDLLAADLDRLEVRLHPARDRAGVRRAAGATHPATGHDVVMDVAL